VRGLVYSSILLLALAGCAGSGDSGARTERSESPDIAPTPPTATAPSAPAPPMDIPTETPTATPTETPSPEDQEGGAGDESPARIRVDLTIDGEGITPPTVTVAPFLALELVVRNDTLRRQRVRFRGRSRSVEAGKRGRLLAPGVRPGGYEVDAGPAGKVRLVAAPPG
jgi:hypothetical protein